MFMLIAKLQRLHHLSIEGLDMYCKKDNKVSLFLCALLTSCILLVIPLASHAITKSLSIVGENGQPLTGTTITITFEDGTKEEEDTDDKGLLVFNFKKKGSYTLTDPAGNVVKTVNITGMDSRTKWEIGAIAAATALILASGSGSDSESSSTSEQSTDTNTDTGTTTEEDTSSPLVTLAGTYNLNCTLASNPGNHPSLVPANSTVDVITQGSNITFYQMGLHGTHNEVDFVASGTGNYAGFVTTFVFQGTQNKETGRITGTLVIGGDGNLPGGQPITYNCVGTPA